MDDLHRLREQELRALNEQLDKQKEEFVRQANEVVRAQEDRLSRNPTAEVDSVRLSQDLRRSETNAARESFSSDAGVLPGAAMPPLLPAPTANQEARRAVLEAAAEKREAEADEASDASPPVLPAAAAAISDQVPPRSRPGSARVRSGVCASAGVCSDAGSAAPRTGSTSQPQSVCGSGSPAIADGSAIGGDEAPAMSGAAEARYSKAQLAVTREEVERLRSLLAAKTTALAEAEANAKELQQRATKHERAERTLLATVEKERAATAEERRRADALERELSLLRKDNEDASRRERNAGPEQRAKDVRLNRALEELQKTKEQLKLLREEREELGGAARAEALRMASENTKLRKRQSELLLAFKKQAKLIDVLKRQKLHVEAATLLSFTEEEFSRTLELGESMA